MYYPQKKNMRTTSKLMMIQATLFATLDIAAQDWDAPVPAAHPQSALRQPAGHAG